MGQFVGVLLLIGFGVIVAFGFALLFCIPLMLCWNYVMPYLFHLPTIGILQAFCLVFVASALIKSSSVNKS